MVQSADHSAVERLRGYCTASKARLRRRFPVAIGTIQLSLRGCEQLGERATETRSGRLGLGLLTGVLMVALLSGTVLAQPACDSGMLKFLGDIETLSVEGIMMLLGIMVVAAGALKGLPIRGTDKWGNSAIGGVIVATTFFVLGPALIDLANQATPVDMAAECSTGGS